MMLQCVILMLKYTMLSTAPLSSKQASTPKLERCCPRNCLLADSLHVRKDHIEVL